MGLALTVAPNLYIPRYRRLYSLAWIRLSMHHCRAIVGVRWWLLKAHVAVIGVLH